MPKIATATRKKELTPLLCNKVTASAEAIAAVDGLAKALNNDDGTTKGINVYIGKPTYKPKANFCLVFTSRYFRLTEILTGEQRKVLDGYCELMAYGNLISANQRDIGKLKKLTEAQVSRSKKALQDMGIISKRYISGLETETLYLHPAFVAMGSLDQFKDEIEIYEIQEEEYERATGNKMIYPSQYNEIKKTNTTPTNTTSCKTASCAIYALFFLSAAVAMTAQIMTMAQTVGI